ncbi:hypothetical protein Scep_030563 [Stephania cephalantha]|uniref:Uncharacterized protein n=1 Tax=Stephania cephalantha TaxID=152367 RepID=A0AAP0E4B6_9MAGN
MDFLSTSNAVDVSACFLVEASGDSEKDMAADRVKAVEEDSAAARADDDAESCCSDGLNNAGYNGYVERGGDENEDEEYNRVEGNDHHGDDEDGEHENDFGSDNTLEDHQRWDELESSMQSEVNKDERSRVESIHGEYLVSEDEKNRVFWDTCLALGYP